MSTTIVVTGGGSGGHITPILAVAAEIKRLQPSVRVVYIGQRGDSLNDLPAQDPHIDAIYTVFAGKFRRYHGEGWRQILDLSTMYKNLRDMCYIVIGLVQSWLLIRRIRPAIVFTRGSFVSVPVALGAALCRIPYITHDSDPMPSLANRLIAPWARLHAVALPAASYPYPPDKTITTGIPLQREFQPVTSVLKQQYRTELGIEQGASLLFVIGGGLGSQRVNLAVAEALPHLLKDFKTLQVVQVVGRDNQQTMERYYQEQLSPLEQGRVQILGFTDTVYLYSGAADVVISRAGATNLAEFAVQGKACIIIPSSFLVAGHQLKNAAYLADRGAAVVMDEEELATDPNRLAKQVAQLLHHPEQQLQLSTKLAALAHPGAAKILAKLILAQINAPAKQAKSSKTSP